MSCKWLVSLIGAWIILYLGALYYELTLPAAINSSRPPQIVYIAPGTPFFQVAELLKKRGLIRSSLGFTLEAYRLGAVGKIKAGEYEIDPKDPPAKIIKLLVEGRVITYFITIPEGYNIYEIARLFEKAGLCRKEEFLSLVKDQRFLSEFGLPGPTAEGFLFPDTYAFYRGLSCRAMITKMIKRFWEVWKDFEPRAEELGLSVKEVITLASIVEKEAVLPKERPLIAGVFWNRLKRGMPLQADPTVRYATGKFYRRLRKRDLRVRHPYNTYIYSGLPPGPICNPGKDSIRAVLYPAQTDFLYFVAKGDGSHHFSRTLKEHQRAVDIYQRKRRLPSWKKPAERLKVLPEKGEKGEENGSSPGKSEASDTGRD